MGMRIEGNVKKHHSLNQNGLKKPRHTPASRREATRRERERVQEIRVAYKSLQCTLNIPFGGRPRYLYILQSAIERIRELESQIGLRRTFDDDEDDDDDDDDAMKLASKEIEESENKCTQMKIEGKMNLYHVEGTRNGTELVYRNL